MILARLAFIIRAYKARVGPLETISIIPIRSFFMKPFMTACKLSAWWLTMRKRVVPGISFWALFGYTPVAAECRLLSARHAQLAPVYSSK
jgi:hypothetical protein